MEFIKFENNDGVATVSLSRGKINALNFQMYQEIKEIFEFINIQKDIRVVILKGEGKMFCPGNDVNEFKDLKENVHEHLRMVNSSVSAVYGCNVPVIAVVHRAALGAGMAIVASCDFIIAEEETLFGIPEIKVGIIGAAEFADLLVPRKLLNYMALTGEPVTAEHIDKYGGIHKIGAKEDLEDLTNELVDKLLNVGPIAVQYFKKALRFNLNAQLSDKYALEVSFTERYVETDDFEEAVNSFLEKRPAVYTGK